MVHFNIAQASLQLQKIHITINYYCKYRVSIATDHKKYELHWVNGTVSETYQWLACLPGFIFMALAQIACYHRPRRYQYTRAAVTLVLMALAQLTCYHRPCRYHYIRAAFKLVWIRCMSILQYLIECFLA